MAKICVETSLPAPLVPRGGTPSFHSAFLVWVLSFLSIVLGCDEPGNVKAVSSGPTGGVGAMDIAPMALAPMGATSMDEGAPSSPCSGADPVLLMDCIDPARYRADLEFIARERTPGSPHWQAVQDLCGTRLAELGFDVERHEYGTGVNVVGHLAKGEGPTLLVSGHYDHIPDCPGADDNATGIAAILEVARIMAEARFSGTLKIACWDEEELGLVGSRAYAERALAEQEVLDLVVVIDMIGYADDQPNSQTLPENLELLFPEEVELLMANEFRADFIPMAASAGAGNFAHAMSEYADLIDLVAVPLVIPSGLEVNPLLADLRRSDHAPFWTAGYPALLISDSAELRNPNYHCAQGQDTLETLDLSFALKVVQSILGAVAGQLPPE